MKPAADNGQVTMGVFKCAAAITYEKKYGEFLFKKGQSLRHGFVAPPPFAQGRLCVRVAPHAVICTRRHEDYHLEKMSRGRSFMMRKEEAKTDIRLAKRSIPAVIATGVAVR